MTTNDPLVTEFYREIQNAQELGLVAHQYDENGQSIYLNNGLKTKQGLVYQGHWKQQQFGSEVTVSSLPFSKTAWDQPFQNLLAGAAILNGKIFFLRYDWITALLTDQAPGGD